MTVNDDHRFDENGNMPCILVDSQRCLTVREIGGGVLHLLVGNLGCISGPNTACTDDENYVERSDDETVFMPPVVLYCSLHFLPFYLYLLSIPSSRTLCLFRFGFILF